MSKNIVYSGQSFLDKVIETSGSIENAFEMALLNGISITDELEVGTTLKTIPPTNSYISGFFDLNNKPATGLTVSQLAELETGGIGSMIIGTNFIVK